MTSKTKKTVRLSVRKAKKNAAARGKPAAKAGRGAKPIDLYYWATPNGFKISIMLEECKLPTISFR
jgi:GST-like protein